jgi:hypothetical protein
MKKALHLFLFALEVLNLMNLEADLTQQNDARPRPIKTQPDRFEFSGIESILSGIRGQRDRDSLKHRLGSFLVSQVVD